MPMRRSVSAPQADGHDEVAVCGGARLELALARRGLEVALSVIRPLAGRTDIEAHPTHLLEPLQGGVAAEGDYSIRGVLPCHGETLSSKGRMTHALRGGKAAINNPAKAHAATLRTNC